MNKRLFSLLLVPVLALTGCGGASSTQPKTALTAEEVTAAYAQAAEAYDWFHLSTLFTEEYDADGLPEQVVTDPRFPTFAAFEAYLKTLFSDELTAELLSDGQYFERDGKLYVKEGARGSNLYLLDKTVDAQQVDEDHWTVTVTFYADSYDMERPDAVIGYSQRTLDYAYADGRWCFTSFCPSDDLDLDAETVFSFTYDDETWDKTDFDSYSDLQLALYLLHSDGAYAEWPSDLFAHRFLENPERVLTALAVIQESPWENREIVVSSVGYSAAAWFAPELLPDFEAALSSCVPKSNAEQAVLAAIQKAYEAGMAQRGPDYLNTAWEFGFTPMGGETLYLDAQTGRFPWGLDLTGEPETVEGSDFGQGYTVESGSVRVDYFEASADGVQYIVRMSTTVPYSASDCVSTVRGTYCGYDEQTLLRQYPKAVRLDAEGYDCMYVYEPLGTKHIAFYMKDGVVAKIEMENLIDGRLLPE